MFRKSLPYFVAATLIISACKKSDPLTGPRDTSVAYVSFTNANSSTKAVNVFVDGAKINNVSFLSPFATLTGIYAGVQPGARTFILRDTATATTITYYTADANLVGGNSYSFYLYDVVTGGALKGILLNTDRKPDVNSANSKVRFLNLSPGSPALDFWLIRRESAVAKDSVKLYDSSPFLGNMATPDINNLSAFRPVLSSVLAGPTPASDYILRVKVAGSATIVASTAATTLVSGRNYTFFARGIYPAVTISSMLNN